MAYDAHVQGTKRNIYTAACSAIPRVDLSTTKTSNMKRQDDFFTRKIR